MDKRTERRLRTIKLPYPINYGVWEQHGLTADEYLDWVIAIKKKLYQMNYCKKNKDRIARYQRANHDAIELTRKKNYRKNIFKREAAWQARKERQKQWLRG